jgi:CSLREA domain-containing protein
MSAFVGTALAACVLAAPAAAEEFPVNSTADPGMGTCDAAECTLREAIAAANGNGSAEVDQIPINVTGTINLTSASQMIVQTPTTITGPGPKSLTVRRQSGNARILTTITAAAADTVRISGMTVADADQGIYASGPGHTIIERVWVKHNTVISGGAGITSEAAVLTVRDSTMSDDHGSFGGGLYITAGDAVVINSTIAGNTATEFGGGIYASGANTTVTLTSSTVVGNKADSDDSGAGNGGGVFNNASGGFIFGSFRIGNSILADNEVGGNQMSPDYECAGDTFTNYGFNLRTTDDADCTFTSPAVPVVPNLLLGSLGDHGGPTPTIELLSGSPAIDSGGSNPPSPAQPFVEPCPATDQRGLPRGGNNGQCDVGAFEVQKPPPSPPAGAAAGVTAPTTKKKCKRKKRRSAAAAKTKKCKKKRTTK